MTTFRDSFGDAVDRRHDIERQPPFNLVDLLSLSSRPRREPAAITEMFNLLGQGRMPLDNRNFVAVLGNSVTRAFRENGRDGVYELLADIAARVTTRMPLADARATEQPEPVKRAVQGLLPRLNVDHVYSLRVDRRTEGGAQIRGAELLVVIGRDTGTGRPTITFVPRSALRRDRTAD